MRWQFLVPVLAAFLAIALNASPASAADVPVNLFASGFEWHVGSRGAPAEPTITVNAGDTLRLRIENWDSGLAGTHTFTVPHFAVDRNLPPAADANTPTVIFVNITTASADVGRWQLWCQPHSSGTDPEAHTGMIGWIVVRSTTPPPTPGFEALAAVGAAAIAFALIAIRKRRR